MDGQDPNFYYNRGSARLAIVASIHRNDVQDLQRQLSRLRSNILADSDDEEESYNKEMILFKKINDPLVESEDLKDIEKGNNGGGGYQIDRNTGISLSQQLKASFEDMNQAHLLQPGSCKYVFGKGLVFEQMKEYKKALREFERAHELDPCHV